MKSKKAARNIVVHQTAFHWRATGSDGFLSITIWPKAGSRIITASLNYSETWKSLGNGVFSSNQDQIVITNRIIQRIILFAKLHYAYLPEEKGHLDLGSLDKAIFLEDAIRSNAKNVLQKNVEQ